MRIIFQGHPIFRILAEREMHPFFINIRNTKLLL